MHNRANLFMTAMLTLMVYSNAQTREPTGPLAKLLKEIRTEAARKNHDPRGRPLPLAAHWNRGSKPSGFSPVYQLELIRRGNHIMPWFEMPLPKQKRGGRYYAGEYLDCFKQVAQWQLPFTLVGTQWEMLLCKSQFPGGPYPWKKLPPEENPCVIDLNGKVAPQYGVSPFGPVAPWKELGRVWTTSPMLQQLQELYPDPPLVIFLSNNEAPKLRWHKKGGVEVSKRYLEKFETGKGGRSAEFKRRVVGNGWIERYSALFASMRSALTAKAWQKNARFVGYNVVGPSHFGRWGGWDVHSLYSKNRFSPWPYAWDGGSPSYYTHNWDGSTDFHVFGPQLAFMNYVMGLRELYAKRPDFWYEFSVWDGNAQGKANDKWAYYEKHGQKYTPERHGSYVEFGMWLTRPRLVREWRGYLDTRKRVGAYFEAVVKVVDRVWADSVLKRFWRKGTLVPNPKRPHPYNAKVPDEYRRVDRYYLLETDLDPKRPWTLKTEIPVFSLAYVIGKPGSREWLIYARSPLKDRPGVQITIPDYKPIKVDVPVAGAFYHVREGKGGPLRAGE